MRLPDRRRGVPDHPARARRCRRRESAPQRCRVRRWTRTGFECAGADVRATISARRRQPARRRCSSAPTCWPRPTRALRRQASGRNAVRRRPRRPATARPPVDRRRTVPQEPAATQPARRLPAGARRVGSRRTPRENTAVMRHGVPRPPATARPARFRLRPDAPFIGRALVLPPASPPAPADSPTGINRSATRPIRPLRPPAARPRMSDRPPTDSEGTRRPPGRRGGAAWAHAARLLALALLLQRLRRRPRDAAEVVLVKASEAEPYAQAEAAVREALAGPARTPSAASRPRTSPRRAWPRRSGSRTWSWRSGRRPPAGCTSNSRPNVRLVYCMVNNAAEAGLLQGRDCAGVTTEVALADQFKLVAETLPRARAVGTLYRSDTAEGKACAPVAAGRAAARAGGSRRWPSTTTRPSPPPSTR